MDNKEYKLPEGAYQIMKWATLVGIPAFATLYVSLSAVWGWPFADEIAKTAAAVCTCLGVVLGISAATATTPEVPSGSDHDSLPANEKTPSSKDESISADDIDKAVND